MLFRHDRRAASAVGTPTGYLLLVIGKLTFHQAHYAPGYRSVALSCQLGRPGGVALVTRLRIFALGLDGI